MTSQPIYLDNQATTRLDPRVLEVMLPTFCEHFGNAASSHSFGREALKAVTLARVSLAKSIGAREPGEIVFTSGATESDNLAVKGVGFAALPGKNHVITVPTEHKAVLDPCRSLEQFGVEVTYLSVDKCGHIDLEELANAITERTSLVSIMAVNNEIGVIHDVAAIGALCRERGVIFHTDATQAVGKVPFNVQEMQVDLASFTAHKLYGPKGVGALYVRRANPEIPVRPLISGGGHEKGMRSGTLNVSGIVGLAEAVRLSIAEREDEGARLVFLRDRLKNGLRAGLSGVYVNGDETRRLPGNLNVSFEGLTGERIMSEMPEIAASTASACSSGTGAASHVLKAIGCSDDLARASIRFGLGRFNTEAEIDFAVQRVIEVVNKLRATG
jgi:cysteine desulfurase